MVKRRWCLPFLVVYSSTVTKKDLWDMPIYEYRCNDCKREFNILILDRWKLSDVVCKSCKSSNLSRLMSRFAFHMTEEARLSKVDTRKPVNETFSKDDRNVGLWAKKRARELGVDLGKDFDKTVEKGRTGKYMDDLER